jgi:hypothetical protein
VAEENPARPFIDYASIPHRGSTGQVWHEIYGRWNFPDCGDCRHELYGDGVHSPDGPSGCPYCEEHRHAAKARSDWHLNNCPHDHVLTFSGVMARCLGNSP